MKRGQRKGRKERKENDRKRKGRKKGKCEENKCIVMVLCGSGLVTNLNEDPVHRKMLRVF
jgi:hypothetical protein